MFIMFDFSHNVFYSLMPAARNNWNAPQLYKTTNMPTVRVTEVRT